MYAQDEAVIATPIGAVRITGNARAITRLAIDHAGTPSAGRAEAVRAAAEQLRGWFAGTLTAFDLPLAPAATPRGQALRDAMVAIPYGDAMSYGALARLAASSRRATEIAQASCGERMRQHGVLSVVA